MAGAYAVRVFGLAVLLEVIIDDISIICGTPAFIGFVVVFLFVIMA